MSSTLNPDEEPQQVVKQTAGTTGALGPSDSSDSGSDVAGAKRHVFDVDSELDNHALETGDAELGSDTDRAGTGERAAADGDSTLSADSDIEPDRISIRSIRTMTVSTMTRTVFEISFRANVGAVIERRFIDRRATRATAH